MSYVITSIMVSQIAIIDRASESCSLIELMDDLAAQSLPIMIPQLAITWMTRRDVRDPASAIAHVFITVDGEDPSGPFPTPIEFGATLGHRSIVTIRGLVIRKPGKVQFSVKINEVDLAQHFFTVDVAGPHQSPREPNMVGLSIGPQVASTPSTPAATSASPAKSTPAKKKASTKASSPRAAGARSKRQNAT